MACIVCVGEINGFFSFGGGAHTRNDHIQRFCVDGGDKRLEFIFYDNKFFSKGFCDFFRNHYVIAVCIAVRIRDFDRAVGSVRLGIVKGSISAFHTDVQFAVIFLVLATGETEHRADKQQRHEHYGNNRSNYFFHFSYSFI